MLRLCICDDNAKDVLRFRDLAESFAGAHPEIPLQIQSFSSSFDLLEHLEEKGGFDIYLLDILMPHLNGLELAKRIRARGEAAELLFLTISREYALEAFDVEASGYLVKPVDQKKFDKILLTMSRRLAQPEGEYLFLKTQEGLRKILIRELVTVESFRHNQVCTLTDASTVVTAGTLKEIMEQLSHVPHFFSPHRAYIVNLRHIAALNSTHLLMSTGQKVPVARANLAALKKAYADYLF